MSHVKIDEEDVVTIIRKLICQLCQSIWNDESPKRRSNRKTQPRVFFDPTAVDGQWLSPEGIEIQNALNNSQNRSQSSTPQQQGREPHSETIAGNNDEGKNIQERLDELEIDVNMSIESPSSDSVIDEK